MANQPAIRSPWWFGPVARGATVADTDSVVLAFGPIPRDLIVEGATVICNSADSGLVSVGLAWTASPRPAAADVIGGRNLVTEDSVAASQPPSVDIRVNNPSTTVLPIAIGSPPPDGLPYLAIYLYWAAAAAGDLYAMANVAVSP